MLSRQAATAAGISQRASAMRRQRRRSANDRLFCRTNGCASFLDLDPRTGVASCHICGYTRRLS